MRTVRLVLLATCLFGCAAPEGDPASNADGGADGGSPADGTSGTEDSGGADGSDGTGGTGLPDSPAPFTVTVSGVLSQALTFTEASCSRPNGSGQLRQFWRGRDHVFVLRVEMLSGVEAAGTFTTADGARAALQEEAGGSGSYFTAGPTDTLEMTLDGLDDDADQAWGSWTVTGMADTSGGVITLGPQPLPLWCDRFL